MGFGVEPGSRPCLDLSEVRSINCSALIGQSVVFTWISHHITRVLGALMEFNTFKFPRNHEITHISGGQNAKIFDFGRVLSRKLEKLILPKYTRLEYLTVLQIGGASWQLNYLAKRYNLDNMTKITFSKMKTDSETDSAKLIYLPQISFSWKS